MFFKKKIDKINIWCQLITFLEVFIKIEVKDNNVEQALRVLKRKLQKDGFYKIIKLKNTYEKPSEKKKRILQENIKKPRQNHQLQQEHKKAVKKQKAKTKQQHKYKEIHKIGSPP